MINDNEKILSELDPDSLEEVSGGMGNADFGTAEYIGASSKKAYCTNPKCRCRMKGDSVRINGSNVSIYKCPNPRCMYYNIEKKVNEVDWK